MNLEPLNRRLADFYGHTENQPNFRVVWSEDQFEKRITSYTNEGLQLLTPEVRLLPKYRQWIQEKYVLERLTVVPQIEENDLITPLSYEPIWVFEDKHGNALEPKWPPIHFIVENLLHRMNERGVYTKYKDPESSQEESLELKKQRVDALVKELFGDETDVGDALAYKEGIVVPASFQKKGDI